jgi:hypothetical protein
MRHGGEDVPQHHDVLTRSTSGSPARCGPHDPSIPHVRNLILVAFAPKDRTASRLANDSRTCAPDRPQVAPDRSDHPTLLGQDGRGPPGHPVRSRSAVGARPRPHSRASGDRYPSRVSGPMCPARSLYSPCPKPRFRALSLRSHRGAVSFLRTTIGGKGACLRRVTSDRRVFARTIGGEGSEQGGRHRIGRAFFL